MSATLRLTAQKPSELLKQTTQAYTASEYLSVDVDVRSYASRSDIKGELLGKGLIRKSRSNYYSKFRTDEMIVNDDCTVIIDHEERSITYLDDDKAKKKRNRSSVQLPNIDSMMRGGDSLVYRGVKQGLRHFTFYSKRSYITQTELYVDEQTKFIRKVIYFYAQNTNNEAYDVYKIELDYDTTNTQRPADTYFDEEKFVSYQKGRPVVNTAYKSYRLKHETE